MKYVPLIVPALCVVLAVPLYAQEAGQVANSDAIEIANLFTWATGATPDWLRGALYAAMGLVGALVTVFGLIGGAVPGTAGFARIEAGMKRMEAREKTLDKLISDPSSYPGQIKAVEAATNNLRDDLREDRRRQFAVAGMLYAILGAFFAAMLARDLLQALVIGAGWTAYLGAMGLKKDYAERKQIKDQTSEKLEAAMSELESGGSVSGLYDLRMEAEVARAL